MKRNFPALILGLIGGVVYLGRSTDEYIEVNAMTGAIRTKIRYAYVFNSPWKIRPTWIDESAARQGIATDEGWQYLSVVSKRLFSTTNACGRAPVSFPVNGIDPEVLKLTATDEIDHFAREFVMANEEKRKQMILIP